MKELGVVAVMLTAQLLDVIVNTLSQAAMKKGMNNFVFVMYSNASSFSKRTLPPLSYNNLGLLFVVGLFSSYLFSLNKLHTCGVREYPAELVVVLIRIALTSILSVPAALISEKDLKAFKLGFNMELIGALH
uniref:WAT1-related protein n=1 Tax=Glycine max TaxID=3847 RepID=K7KUP4_SOYBN